MAMLLSEWQTCVLETLKIVTSDMPAIVERRNAGNSEKMATMGRMVSSRAMLSLNHSPSGITARVGAAARRITRSSIIRPSRVLKAPPAKLAVSKAPSIGVRASTTLTTPMLTIKGQMHRMAKINRKIQTKHKMLRSDIEKVIQPTGKMKLSTGLAVFGAGKKWLRRTQGKTNSIHQRNQRRGIERQETENALKIENLKQKVRNHRMSTVQMEKVNVLMEKENNGTKLAWFDYFVILLNDEVGAGRHIQRVFSFGIFVSLSLLILTDMPQFTPRGEGSLNCELTIRPSCQRLQDHVFSWKNVESPPMDVNLNVPLGCLVPSRVNRTIITDSLKRGVVNFKWTPHESEIDAMSEMFLLYECSDETCFGQGANFGSRGSNVTCNYSTDVLPDRRCVHPNCAQDALLIKDLTPAYFYVDLFVTSVFSIELILSFVFCHASAVDFFSSAWTWIDIIATVPSIFTISFALASGTTSGYHAQQYFGPSDVSHFLGSGVFELFRFFKIFKHIPEVTVLSNTFLKVADQLFLVYSFMIVSVLIFAFVLYYTEKGRECFFEDVDGRLALDSHYNSGEFNSSNQAAVACTAEDVEMLQRSYKAGLLDTLPIYGERFQIDIKGELSQFADIWLCGYFFVVTVTSVGYGDLSPVSTMGKIITVVGMLFGAVYVAMPLTLVGGEYHSLWVEYEKHVREAKTKHKSMTKLRLSHEDSLAFTMWCNSLSHLDRCEESLVSTNNGPNADPFAVRVSKIMAEQQEIMRPYYKLNKVILAIKAEGERQQYQKELDELS
jgi:hypothetical protein